MKFILKTLTLFIRSVIINFQDKTEVVIIWPPEWSYDQWIKKKSRYPWLICYNRKIGCENCKLAGELKTYKSQGVEISTEWSQTNIDGGINPKIVTQSSILRHKIARHNKSKAHIFSSKIDQEKSRDKISTAFETSTLKNYNPTVKIFHTVYYISKNNRPFDDHTGLVELQEMNGICLGQILHSRYSSTTIANHIQK